MTAPAYQFHPATGALEATAAALTERFWLLRKPTRKLLVTFLDDPEHSLYRAGLLLWEEQDEATHRLVLNGLLETETPSSVALQGGRPRNTAGIGFKPMREQIHAILGDAPLTPVLSVEIHRTTLRMMNEEQRTVLRIECDDYLIPLQSGVGEPHHLPPRIRLQQVRSAAASIQEAQEFLLGQGGIPAASPMLADALRAIGREPPPAPTLTPPEPASPPPQATPQPTPASPPSAPRGSMHIFGVYNIKGGVGKTATAVNLAWLASHAGYRTLVWDLDPQAAATFYFRNAPGEVGDGHRLVTGREELDRQIRRTEYPNLDLLPSDFSYRNMDLVLDATEKPAKQLMKLLRPLSQVYDFLFLDCPPNVSLVSENVFRAADALLIPTIPTTLSQRTLDQLLDFLQGHGLTHVRLMPFLSMVDRRKKLHLNMVEELPKRYPDMLRSAIPYAAEIERMGVNRAPVFAYARRSHGGVAYEALWQELVTRLEVES